MSNKRRGAKKPQAQKTKPYAAGNQIPTASRPPYAAHLTAGGAVDPETLRLSDQAAQRVTAVMNKMTKPYEAVLMQLQRMGITPKVIDIADDAGEPVKHFAIPCEEMLLKELEYVKQGGLLNEAQPVNPILDEAMKKVMEQHKKGVKDGVDGGKSAQSQARASGARKGSQPSVRGLRQQGEGLVSDQGERRDRSSPL